MSAIDDQPEQPLCIHFVNTISRHDGLFENDRLSDFDGFLAWTDQAKLFSKAEVRRWGKWSQTHGSEARRFLASVIQFREYLFDLFSKSAAAQRIGQSKLADLNTMLGTSALQRTLEVNDDGVIEACDCGDGLMAPLRKVALSAADVLLDGSWRKVICCDRDECDWLAVDTSRNHSRRYCSSSGCGNLARATRHYRRHKTPIGPGRLRAARGASLSSQGSEAAVSRK